MARRFLQEKFSEFLIELQAQKAAVQAGRWAFYGDAPKSFEPSQAGGRGPNPIWDSLASLLRRQADEASRSGASAQALYQEAQYAMIALADEVFITALGDWPGRQDWKSYHLELAFFNSSVAGTEIFRRIDRLLARLDPGQRDLAEIYFHVLSLGFKGAYATALHEHSASGRAPPEIEERRRRLRECFDSDDRRDGGRVSPQPYEHIETRDMGGKIPSVLESLSFLGAVLVCLLLATWATSYFLTGSIRGTLGEIESKIEVQSEKSGSE